MPTKHTLITVFRIFILATIFLCLFIGCDSSDPTLDNVVVAEGSNTSLMAPRNPETYMVYIQPDDPDYHISTLQCLKEGRSVVSEAEALELGYEPCEICFPPPPEPVELNVYVLTEGTDYHRSGCRYLDGTETVVAMAVAVNEGYLPCPGCYSELAGSRPLNVWVTPETELYHREYCPNLTDDKVLMSLTAAEETGYTPDPICYWQTERIIKRGVIIVDVLYNPEGTEPYNEIITLENRDGFSVDIGDWILTDGEGEYKIPIGTTIVGGGTWSVSGFTYNPTAYTRGLYLSNRHDTLTLYNNEGNLVDAVSW